MRTRNFANKNSRRGRAVAESNPDFFRNGAKEFLGVRFRVRDGYSLVEVIVYVSLLASLSVFVIGSVLSIYKAFAKTRIDRAISQNGTVAMETMIRETRQAISIDGAASTFGANPGTLALGAKKFSLSGGAVKVQDGTNPAQDLTSGVTATSLIFYRDTVASSEVSSDIVKIELTLEGGEGAFFRRITFFGSAVVRGAY